MKVLPDSRASLVTSPGNPLPSVDTEALFKEARQRRRRRRAWMAVGIVVVLAFAFVALTVAHNHRGGPPSVPAHRVGGSRTLPAAPRPGNQGAGSALQYTPIQEMGMADGSVGWAANGTGIYLTADQGARWRTITPPNLAHGGVSEHIGAMDAVGQTNLWLALEDVPGLVDHRWGRRVAGEVGGQGEGGDSVAEVVDVCGGMEGRDRPNG